MDDDYDMTDFELDFCVACNLMLGMPYHEAVREARTWVMEAQEDQA